MQTTQQSILVLNGPNLNRLGKREIEIYGKQGLEDIETLLNAHASKSGFAVDIDIRTSNHEGDLIDWIHEADDQGMLAVLLNAGALTHTSLALYDAIKAVSIPVIEVHISNPHARESFRSKSLIAGACRGTVQGFGIASYRLALDAALTLEQ